jgi:hypothetical protein
MTCKSCRVTFEGQLYFIAKNGCVYPTWQNIATVPGGYNTWSLGEAVENGELAKQVRHEAARQRRNRRNRYVRERMSMVRPSRSVGR